MSIQFHRKTRIATLLTVALFFILTGSTLADDTFKPNIEPSLEISRAAGKIKIDGEIGDEGWRGAAEAANFAEREPGDQIKPLVDTRVLVTYDSDNFYVLFVCHDDPDQIRRSICERDVSVGDDNVCIVLDTYGNAAWTYELFANPYGIQRDKLWSRSGGEDAGYDLIWESAGTITESGYQVEMAIPFSSLRFPNTSTQTWRIDFWRNRPREHHHQYSWAANDRDDPCWVCQFGTLTGIENVEPGKGIEILPTFLAFQSGELPGRANFDNDDPKGEISLGAKYSVNSNITAEATFNPDFSQVESDAGQIDVNTTFALFYPERRPFFQEGSDLFRTWMSAVYTRSINDPQFAAKVTSRMNRTSGAYLIARDEHTPMILPFEESSAFLLADKSVSQIFRVRHVLGEDTHVGLLLTDRRIEGGGSGTLLSADGELRLSKRFRIQWQAVASHTEEPDDPGLSEEISLLSYYGLIDSTFDKGKYTSVFDGESFSGYHWVVNFEERSRNTMVDLAFREISPTYRADNGFEPQNNRRVVDFTSGYIFYFDNENFIQRFNPSLNLGRVWNYDGERKDEWVRLQAELLMKGQTSIHSMYLRSAENYRGVQFDNIWNSHICVDTRLNEMIGCGGSINHGNLIARRETPPVMGRQSSASFWLDIKPTDRLLIEPGINYIVSDDLDSGEELFSQLISRTRVNYQFTRELSMRLVVQYDDYYDCWDVDPLLTYRLSPFSLFYVGSTVDYTDLKNGDGEHQYWKVTTRQFFMKLQYLFQV
ncbi:MAG: DUF5916 domain-containing protein [Candidatus Zixiibacteriota bacterium]